MEPIKWLQNLNKPKEEQSEESDWNKLNDRLIELYNNGQYQEAIPLGEQARQLAVEIWGPTNGKVAISCNNLALLYDSENRQEEAEPLYLEAIDIDRKALPADHARLASDLDNLAQLYYSQNRQEEAEPLLIEAIELDREALPSDHPQLATHLNNLAELYKSQDRLEKAEPLYLEAIGIIKKVFPKDDASLAPSLDSLALLYQKQNRLAEAEPLYVEAIALHRQALPADDPELAGHLNNLALLYDSQNRLAKAEPLYLEAIEIVSSVLPSDHPYLTPCLNNLALLYDSQNRLEEAEPLFLQVIDIDRKALPENHPQIATHLNNLAKLYQKQNRLEEAEPLHLEAIEIDKKALPSDHPSLARDLNNLAQFYQKQNSLEEAERLYLEAIEIDKKALPSDHPQLATHLNNLALLLAKTDRPEAAFKLMLQGSKIEEINVQRYFSSSSESGGLTYLQSIKTNFEIFLSLIYQHLSHKKAAKQAALNLLLKRKALAAAAQAAFNSAIVAGRYPHLQDTFQQWRQLSDKLLQLSEEIPSPEEVASHREELARVQKQCNDLQKQLGGEVLEIRLQEQICDRKAVAASLPAGTSLVKFARFNVYNFKEDRWEDARYVAFILPAGQPSEVETIDLGEADPIDNLVVRYREALVIGDQSSNENAPESESAPEGKLHLYNKEAGNLLREAVFDKVRPFLGSCRNLVFAPDGDLNLVPLGILPLEWGDRTLRDEYAINAVSSGRAILLNSTDIGREPGPALTVAAPNYDFSSSDIPPVEEESSELPPTEDESSDIPPVEEESSDIPPVEEESSDIPPVEEESSDMESSESPPVEEESEKLVPALPNIPFRHLPETGDLAAAVAQRLGAETLLGDAALVGELLARRSPKVLFVATHGFFFQKRGRQNYYQLVRALLSCLNGEEKKVLKQHELLLDEELLEVMAEVATYFAESGSEKSANWLWQLAEFVEGKISDRAAPPSTAYRPKVKDPMLRTGIALAGANSWSWGDELPKEAGKGVLFARDIAALDFLGTELVILVACQSGLGELATGEGVVGLRRAVAVAGAKNLIMSLWKVPIYATILLMEHLFDKIDAGWLPAEALDMAQDYLKNVTVGELRQSELGNTILGELDIDEKHPAELKPLEHPYYWGAWICQGVSN